LGLLRRPNAYDAASFERRGALMGALKDLRIDAYRALRGVELSGFGRVNLLVGGNNAGKTSILEAIGLVARPFDPGQWVQTVTNRDASGSVLDGLWSLFPGSTALALEAGEAGSASIDIHASFGDGSRHLTASASAAVEQWVDADRAADGVEAEVQVEAVVETPEPSRHLHGMSFHSTPKRVPVGTGVSSLRVFLVTPATHRSTQQLITHLSHAINLGAKEKAVEVLRMFDPGVKDVLMTRSIDREAIRVDHTGNGIVDLSTFGDGMRRAFAMSLALARASGGILLVDEIESTIHTRVLGSMLPWLARAAEAADVQIVATTHSLEAIDAVLGAFADDEVGVVAYYLRRTEAGHVCRRHDLSSLRDLRSEGLDIR
jgi:AAA domain, putative AbiEii toxin, Type IV TA system